MKLSLAQLYKLSGTWYSNRVLNQVKEIHEKIIAGKCVKWAIEEIGSEKQQVSTNNQS